MEGRSGSDVVMGPFARLQKALIWQMVCIWAILVKSKIPPGAWG
jgi:hypothetical protein